MKRLSIIVIAIVAAMQVSAALRPPADALRIADEFMETSSHRIPRAPSQSPITNHQSQIVAESDLYLAVNTRGGYVLVGADDRMPEVLGYNPDGGFDPDNIAPALRFWLDCYEEELDQMSNLQSPISNRGKPFPRYLPSVPPNGTRARPIMSRLLSITITEASVSPVVWLRRWRK